MRDFRASPRKRISELESLGVNSADALSLLTGSESGSTGESRSLVDLIAHLERKAAAGVSWEEGRLLYLVTREIQPTVAIETGVGRGTSTAFILQAMDDVSKGELHSIDIRPEKEIGDAIPEGLKERWHYHKGKTLKELPAMLEEIGTICLFFHDSDHSYRNMLFEFEAVWPHLSDGCVMLAHDANQNDAFLDFSDRTGRRPVVLRSFGYLSGLRK